MMMNKMVKKLTAGFVAAMMVGTMSLSVSFAADNAFGIDELNWTEEDWNCIAVTNDDTVETGAVIRVSADSDSDAAGFLYRGAAAQVINKGEEWSEVKSGSVTGFVKNEYLAFGDNARGLAAHYGKEGVVANWDDVNVFTKNDTDSDVSGQLKGGSKMSLVKDDGELITVQSGKDSVGYVSREDVSKVLLMDTAVPATGEDVADVPSNLTAEDVPAAETTLALAESSGDASVEAASEYTEETSADTSEYTEETCADCSDYTQDYAASETYETQAAYTEETSADYTVSAASVESTQQVSDDPTIQGLYDNYMKAYNEAVNNVTSEEDAYAKAQAATDAWNAYLTACGETSALVSAPASETTSTAQTAVAETYTETSSQPETTTQPETQATVQTEAQTEAQVAASSGSSAYGNYSDLDLLAAIIWCEAGNQSYDGMVAVGQVVMNRVYSSSWPNTISEVLNQPGQFTPASSGTLQSVLASGVNSTCYQAAQDAMNGASPVPGTPMYFNTHSGSYQLGAHYFS